MVHGMWEALHKLSATYADDLVIREKSHDRLRSLLHRLEKEALKVGLHINEDKTK